MILDLQFLFLERDDHGFVGQGSSLLGHDGLLELTMFELEFRSVDGDVHAYLLQTDNRENDRPLAKGGGLNSDTARRVGQARA
jgi:hypothetical protein